MRRRCADFLLVAGCLCTCASVVLSLVLLHVGFVAMALGVVVGARPIHRLPGFRWGCLFAAWQVLGILVRPEGTRSFPHQGYGTTFIWLTLYPVALVLADDYWRRWALHLMMVSVLASLILAFLQFFIGNGGARPFRVSSAGLVMMHSSGFTPLHLTQGFIMTQMALIFSSQRQVIDATAAAIWTGRVTSLMAVVLANSRAGLLAMLAGFATWFASSQGRTRWRAIAVLAFGTPLLTAWFWLMNAEAFRVMAALNDGRLIIWNVAAHVIGENPWFGVGEGNFKAANDRWLATLYPDHSQDIWLRAPDAHNSVLGLASEHGIPAVILFTAFLASILLHVYRRRHVDRRAWRLACGAVAALVVGSQFEHYAGHSVPSYAFFVAIAFALACLPVKSDEVPREAAQR